MNQVLGTESENDDENEGRLSASNRPPPKDARRTTLSLSGSTQAKNLFGWVWRWEVGPYFCAGILDERANGQGQGRQKVVLLWRPSRKQETEFVPLYVVAWQVPVKFLLERKKGIILLNRSSCDRLFAVRLEIFTACSRAPIQGRSVLHSRHCLPPIPLGRIVPSTEARANP